MAQALEFRFGGNRLAGQTYGGLEHRVSPLRDIERVVVAGELG
jgi:hypothetical protein